MTVRRQWLNLGIFLVFLWLNRYSCTQKCFLEKIKSKLQGSYSSNLTSFHLNRRIFVFFTRGGSKLFTPNHLVNCALNMSQYFRKMIWSNFATIIWQFLHKKTSFGALEKWKMALLCNESENSLRQHCLEFQDAPLCII